MKKMKSRVSDFVQLRTMKNVQRKSEEERLTMGFSVLLIN